MMGLAGAAVLTNPQPAQPFELTDQFGASRSLEAFRGKPVALTFVYTHCPDVCPLIASNMHAAYRLLGENAANVAMLAVSVDPEGDDAESVRTFSEERGLLNEWSYLTGSRPQLEAVWQRYGVMRPAGAMPGHSQGAGQGGGQAELIEHAAPVMLIDKRGLVRALLPTTFAATTLASDLQALLAEP
jgi:protein SCO1/2